MAQADNTFTYLQSDFASQKAALIQRVRSRFPGVWNDFYQGSFGVLYIDIASWALANTAYTVNRLAGENFIPTMQLRESAVRFGALIGYQLRGPTPASVPCAATIASVVAADIVLAKGTPVRSASPVLTFELDADYTIPAGELTPLAIAATFNPQETGSKNVTALVNIVNGSINADCLDLSVDLRQYVQVGQLFRLSAGAAEYLIVSIEQAPGATGYNRMVLGTAWATATVSTTAQVVDRRVVFVQGQTQQEQFTAPAQTAAFTYKLAYTDVISGSVEVAVNGEAWAPVTNLINADATEEVFQARTLATGETIVAFGDGLFGAELPPAATVVVGYRTGGGAAGNVPSGSVSSSVTGIVSSLSTPIAVTIVNNQPGSGGLDAESVDEARAKIPAFVRTNDRAVTLSDYETLATSFSSPAGQVRYARAVVRTQNALLEGNVVVVYGWTAGQDGELLPLSNALKSQLQQYLQAKAVGTDYVLIADGSAVAFPLASRFKAVPGYEVAVVEDSVIAAAAAYIAQLTPGAPVVYSQLLTTLAAVAGVAAIDVAAPDTDIAPPNNNTVFSAPQPLSYFAVAASSTGANAYTAQAPSAPLAAWSLRVRLNGTLLNLTADTTPGYARLTGIALDTTEVSTVNLQTGVISFYTTGTVASFEVGFVAAQGYSRSRVTDIYVGYSGDTSAAKRSEIRAALRAWASALPVGAPLFADEVLGSPDSVVSARAVVEAVPGVVAVAKVALDAPANTSPRLDVSEYELVQVRGVYLNGLQNALTILIPAVGTVWKIAADLSSMCMS